MDVRHEHSEQGNVDFDGTPSIVDRRHHLSVVYGGGGVFGIAYGMGVAQGLADRGVPIRTAPSLGTSAGSWVASAMTLGLDFDAVDAMEVPSVPNTQTGVLADVARAVFGEASHRLVSVSAVCLRSRRRHVLDGGAYPLADLIAASSAVPGVFPPHRIDGRMYIDGGMWSATSVDAATDAQEVIVIAPLAGPTLGPIGRGAGLLLNRELRQWRKRHPDRRITLIRPNKEIGRLAGRTPLGLFDADRGREVYPLAYEQGLRWAARLAEPGQFAAA